MAKPHKFMNGMELLTKAARTKKGAETSLQNLGSSIKTMLLERQKRGNQKAKQYHKQTGGYPG
jgi:hypothetical protein